MATAGDHDILIGGAGPVGLALAAMLVRQGMPPQRIALIDARPLEQAVHDPRSLALSWGSRQLLEEIRAWPAGATPIREIHVSRRGHFGRTLMTAAEFSLPELGYVSRYGALVRALSAAATAAGVHVLRPMLIASREETADGVALLLADGRSLHGRIMVQAEGGLFADQPGKPISRDYNQTAVISHVTVSAPIEARAFERFTDEGPLALLPQDDGYALVWCLRPARAGQVAALPDDAFLAQLQQAFGHRLGRILSATPRISYPLGLNAGAHHTARMVAIGNAAQTLHPVAGQGLNLGLRDAAVLSRMLATDATPLALQRYVSRRSPDRRATIALTDAMARVFSSAPDGAFSQGLLGISLGLMDMVRPVKSLLAEQMMFGRR
ncbi:FAD-dependent monooxygenase [Noviherbaspirillum suwonense]|uniref:2-octaprenyl-6-methoxyphenol hydroxylase n=1 Tax=Noviherbaspirillum suwonense TaxID=1224511 RepID=A0ABY1QEV3_9BURK|nr:FAD-dependent monooxygenase [Noviherbaspirillum suwonense]SMP67573.1 2-octaprenyl-6-methoxyphenol hydroxylase [Noviherbaspirillum suwonense]